MSKRNWAWLLVAFVGALCLAGLIWATVGSDEIVFTEPNLQARLNRELPKTVKDITIDRVAARLADNRLGLVIELHGAVLREPISAVVSTWGVPRYEPGQGELFFDAESLRIDQLQVVGRNVIAADSSAPRARLTEAASAAAQRLADGVIKAYLRVRPVYRFKDDFKGFVLKAALVDVKVGADALVVTFSLWRLTSACFAFAASLLGLLLIAYWLLRNPLWGVVTIVGAVSEIVDSH